MKSGEWQKGDLPFPSVVCKPRSEGSGVAPGRSSATQPRGYPGKSLTLLPFIKLVLLLSPRALLASRSRCEIRCAHRGPGALLIPACPSSSRKPGWAPSAPSPPRTPAVVRSCLARLCSVSVWVPEHRKCLRRTVGAHQVVVTRCERDS